MMMMISAQQKYGRRLDEGCQAGGHLRVMMNDSANVLGVECMILR